MAEIQEIRQKSKGKLPIFFTMAIYNILSILIINLLSIKYNVAEVQEIRQKSITGGQWY